MTTNELRLGNIVNYYNDSTIFKVVEISEKVIVVKNEVEQTWIEIDQFDGVELDEEWLLKFGFSLRESSTSKQWYIGINEITKDWLFDIIWLEKPELINAPNAPFYRNGRHTIFYVHQLQNLYFALTGEELVLKEN